MIRSWMLACGLGSALLYTACGNNDDEGLFGSASKGKEPIGGTVSSIDPSIGEEGGEAGASGGQSSSPKGGASTGGDATDPGGAPASGGSDSEPAPNGGSNATTGGSSASVGGSTASGGEPELGGAIGAGGEPEVGGAPGSGGTSGGDGGTNTGGASTGGTSTGGTTTGGTNTGGTTGGSPTGGQDGTGEKCEAARQAMSEALIEARDCNPEDAATCTGFVENDCGCNVPVNDPTSPEAAAYAAAVKRVISACGRTVCAAFAPLTCIPDPRDPRCVPDDTQKSGGQCAVARTPLPVSREPITD